MSLDTLFVTEKSVKVGDFNLVIKQISVETIPHLSKLMEAYDHPDLKNKKTDEKLKYIVKNHLSDVKSLFTVLTNLTPEQVEKLSAAGVVMIFGEVIKENASFLAQSVMPQMEDLKNQMAGLFKSKS